jgi:hypothetical protein
LKAILFLLTCIILLSSCNKKTEFDCSPFKTGKFQQNLEEENAIIYSTRTEDGFQKDSSKFGVSKYKINWKSDCKCEAKLLETSNNYSKKYIGRKYYVEIAEKISDKEYIYNCHVDGIDFIDQDTIIKTN